MAKRLAPTSPTPDIQKRLQKGGDDMEDAVKDLVNLTNDYLRNPTAPGAQDAVDRKTRDVDDIVDYTLGVVKEYVDEVARFVVLLTLQAKG